MPSQREESESEEEYEEEEASYVEDDDEDNDEDDDNEEVEEFEDEADEKEPMYDSNDPYQEYEPTKQPSSTRLSTQDEESWRDRNMAPIIACICCCLCLIIVAILLGILLPRHLNKDNDPSSFTIDVPTEAPVQAPFTPVTFPTPPPVELTPSAKPPPTPYPTVSPAPTAPPIAEPTPKPTDYPTIAPSMSPAPTKSIPDKLVIVADQDTTVYLDGFYIGESYGRDPTFLVQHGLAAKEEVPNAVGLLTFPLDDVPAFDRLGNTKKNAILRLNHEPTEPESGSATYTVVRMPGTPMKVEFLHGYIFKPPEDGEEGAVVGPEFTVNPDTTVVDIDITSLLFDAEDDHQLYLMIQDRGPEQPEGGDRFYSREHPDLKPQLLIDFQGGNAADVVMDVTADEQEGDGEVAPSEPSQEGDETGAQAPSEPPREGDTDIGALNSDGNSTESDVFMRNETDDVFDDTNATVPSLNETTGDEGVDDLSTTAAPSPAVRRRRV